MALRLLTMWSVLRRLVLWL